MQIPLKGSLAETGFIEILKDAAQSKLTGMVRVENGTVIKVAYFQQGSIAFASSNEKLDRLTEVLKRAGKLTPEQIEHAQARLKPNVSLGKTLVELGYISAKDLLWGARTQVESILHQLLFWTEGNYQVLEGALPKEIVSLNIPVSQIIFDGVSKTQDRQWILQHIESPQTTYALSPDFHEANATYKLPVENVISRLNGKRNLEEVAQSAGLDTFEVCKTVVALQLLNLVQRSSEPPAPVPVLVEEQEEAVQAVELPITTPPTENLSLGQMMQIPTVQELQQSPPEESMDEVETPAIEEKEEEVEDLAIEPAAPTLQLSSVPTIIQPPLQLSEPEPEEEEEKNPIPIPPPPIKMAEPEPQELEEEEEPFPIDEQTAAKESRHVNVPMQDFSYSRRDYPQHSQFNWRTMAIIMGVLLVALFGGYTVYSRYKQHAAATDLDYAQNTPPAKKVQPQESKPAVNPTTPAPKQNPAAAPVTQKPVTVVPTQQASAQPKPAPPVQKPTPAVAVPTKAASTPMDLLNQGKLPEAAHQWESNLRKQQSSYTIQLEIACQEKTVKEAVSMTGGSKDLAIIPLDYKGQACYRVLYGVYASEATAQSARAKLPQDFLKQPSPPQIVPLTKLIK